MEEVVPPSTDGIYDLADLPNDPAPVLVPGSFGFVVDVNRPGAPTKPAAPASPNPPVDGPANGAKERVGGLFARLTRSAKPVADEPAPSAVPAPTTGVETPPVLDAGVAPAAPASAAAPPTGASNAKPPAAPDGGKLARKKKAKRTLKFSAPAWVASLAVHLGVLGVMAGVALNTDSGKKVLQNLNASMLDTKTSALQAEELTPILADPNGGPRDAAVSADLTATPGVGTGLGSGVGSGPPSATPAITASTRVGERSNLPSVKITPRLSGLSMLPTLPNKDLGNSGGGSYGSGSKVSGDVTYETADVGVALDQVAREILRHLQSHKVTVVWLFDESGSMKDDQRAIRDKFDRVTTELKLNLDNDQKSKGALNHAIVGFGSKLDIETPKPTTDIDVIRRKIDNLKVDETGIENTMHAIYGVIQAFGNVISKDRRLLIILVTDESGDDGADVEEARQAAVSRGVPLYVIGRQSLFGYSAARLLYIDPVTKDHYWPIIRRGPETGGIECLQYDGLHDRWDEQPSGFAPYELARIAKETGGIYFLLPSEESMRVSKREKAYSIQTLKEYVPDYESRIKYIEHRNNSELRRTLFELIQLTGNTDPSKGLIFSHRRHFPIDPALLAPAIIEERPKALIRLNALLDVEKKLRSIKKYRDREPDKRWQAHFDLMLAETVTYQVKAYEYRACLDEMLVLLNKNKLAPKTMPNANLVVEWVIDHSKDRKSPKQETEKKYAEAEQLLKEVIAKHPKTPWADLAQDELNRGFGCQRNEWHHDPRYEERAKLVPKY
jgi:von Willebrand factor type A domain